jgi:hypothetical protein
LVAGEADVDATPFCRYRLGADPMRRFIAAVLAGICVLAAACAGNNSSAPASPSAKAGSGGSTTSTPPPPVAVRSEMGDDTAYVSDKNCLAVYDAVELPVYAGSGWSAVRHQNLRQPGDKFTELVEQAVVLFPAAADAAAFFTTSTK